MSNASAFPEFRSLQHLSVSSNFSIGHAKRKDGGRRDLPFAIQFFAGPWWSRLTLIPGFAGIRRVAARIFEAGKNLYPIRYNERPCLGWATARRGDSSRDFSEEAICYGVPRTTTSAVRPFRPRNEHGGRKGGTPPMEGSNEIALIVWNLILIPDVIWADAAVLKRRGNKRCFCKLPKDRRRHTDVTRLCTCHVAPPSICKAIIASFHLAIALPAICRAPLFSSSSFP